VRPTPFDARPCRSSMKSLLVARKLHFLDIGCGTGRFLDFVKQIWPRLRTIGLDMSEAYLKHAQRHLKRWTRTGFVVGKAEAIPLPR
jgi:ubiquinone/menaquinone biosynthesis C-methylase UbiE